MKFRKTKAFHAEDMVEVTDMLITQVCNLMSECKEDSSKYYACSALLDKLDRISSSADKRRQKQSKEVFSMS